MILLMMLTLVHVVWCQQLLQMIRSVCLVAADLRLLGVTDTHSS